MRNGSAGQKGDVSYDFSNEFRTESRVFAASSGWRYYSNSGYTGPRPKPLTGVIHGFSYRISEATCSFSQTDEAFRPTYIRTTEQRAGGYLSQSIATVVGFPSLESDTLLYNRLLDKYYDKTRGQLDLSIDLAEMGQTRKMLSATNQVTSLAATLAKRFGPVKLAAGLWLQYQYGWRPLLSTVYQAAEESQRFVLNKLEKFSVRETERFKLDRVSIVNYNNSSEALKAIVNLKRSMTIGATLATANGFDPQRWSSLNPVSIAWELMPYSFVVDWFYNVGGYLRSLESSVLQKNSFRGGYISKIVAADGSINDTRSSKSKDLVSTFSASGAFRYRDFNRTILNSPPTPRLPTFKAQLGSSRLLSAAALLSNFLGRR